MAAPFVGLISRFDPSYLCLAKHTHTQTEKQRMKKFRTQNNLLTPAFKI